MNRRLIRHLLMLCACLVGPSAGQAQEPAVWEGKTVRQWADQLTDADLRIRWYATYALGQIGPPAAKAAEPLLKILEDQARTEHEYVRVTAAWSLGRIGSTDEATVSVLAKTLKSTLPAVRRGSAEALGRLGPAGKPAAGDLLKALEDGFRRAGQRSRCPLQNPAGRQGGAGADRVVARSARPGAAMRQWPWDAGGRSRRSPRAGRGPAQQRYGRPPRGHPLFGPDRRPRRPPGTEEGPERHGRRGAPLRRWKRWAGWAQGGRGLGGYAEDENAAPVAQAARALERIGPRPRRPKRRWSRRSTIPIRMSATPPRRRCGRSGAHSVFFQPRNN